jgi:hypothetical protein
MKKLTALVLLSFLAAASVRANVIWQELFTYAGQPGCITNLSGTFPNALWICHSGSGNPDAICNGNKEEIMSSSAYLGITSGMVRQDDVHRNFATAPGSPYTNVQQVIYASYIVNFTNLPTAAGAYFAHFQYSSTGFSGRLWALTNGTVLPNTFRLAISAGTASTPSATYPVDLALNTDYQVVLGLNPTAGASSDGYLPYSDTVTLWINSISPGDHPIISSDAYTPGVNIANAYGFRQASGFGGFLTVSNLVVATTFAEAATNVWTTNAVAPKIVYQPTAVISNFVGAAFKVSAVANGQGLGSLIYKWQVSATPDNASPSDITSGDLSGTTANVLSFDYADVLDSGYYTLVATTPYGLSVTSSVSKVSISAAPVPPTFITQPGSQTVYKGQTVTFSTSVSSPGYVTFTWYSNNVVVTDGQVDNGSSSSYVLNNVQTNLSGAIFKVAATNDVVTTSGIVSTNAVLTVLNPQQVTIAYLRSLVDPGNGYSPSPNPLTTPYQITGTVTTFTNITSGNTSSYYLQDGTAGIDIFVTGSSAFRPAQGDVVTFVGVLSAYTTGLELNADVTPSTAYPYTSYVDTGATNALPTPISIGYNVLAPNNLTNVNLNIAESLVTLSGVYFGTNAGTIITNHIITVTNSSGQSFSLQTFPLDLDTLGQTFPAYASSVTGVLYGINTNFTIAITRFADIVAATPPPSTIIPTTSPHISGISLVNGNVVITATNGQTTGVYYLLASTNIAKPLSQWIPVATNVVTTSGANGAFTFTDTNGYPIVGPGAQVQLAGFYILSNTNSNHP